MVAIRLVLVARVSEGPGALLERARATLHCVAEKGETVPPSTPPRRLPGTLRTSTSVSGVSDSPGEFMGAAEVQTTAHSALAHRH